MQLKELFEDKKRLGAILIAAAACIFLCISSFSSDKNDTKTNADGEENPVYEIEQRLENVLESIKGAGKVEVFIMLDDFGTKNFVSDTKSVRKEEETQVETSTVLGGGSSGTPILSQNRAPSVKGIIITAQGAENETVKKCIKDAVCASLAVMPHRVEIAVGK